VRRLLDLGCAEGRTLLELRRLLGATELVGVEASPELAAAAPPLPEGVRIEVGDVTRLPAAVGAERFDLVTALAVLEHLREPVAAVREAARVLRPGGLFVATCPEPRWDAVATRLGLLEDGQHEADLGRRQLEELVGEAGLELVSYRRFMFAPVGALPYLRAPVSPAASWAIDRAVGALRVLDWAFVNQRVVARRP
jgi:SAM-dependent methyltransferase